MISNIVSFLRNVFGRNKTEYLVFTKVIFDGAYAVEGIISRMAVLNDIQQIQVAVEGRSARGSISQVYDIPVWVSETPNILSVEAAPDGLSAVIKAAGELGDGVVRVTAKVRQDAEEYRDTTITIPVAASETETLFIVEGAITIQPEFV